MNINIEELEVGCIVQQDIYGKTQYPIIPKNTVVSELHMQVLKDFLIQDIVVEKTKADGSMFLPRKTLTSSNEDSLTTPKMEEKDSFIDLYLKGVQSFKKEFMNWQSGMSVNVANMREIILPLLNEVIENPSHIYSLNQYSSDANYLYHHPVAVSLLSGMIAKKLGMTTGQINQVALAGALADCGMAKVSQSILNKSNALSEAEFKEVKMHIINGFNMVKDTPLLKSESKLAIYQHHERLDGSGYPSGETKGRVHTHSQIIAVSDVFHAMTSERAYRSKQPIFKVLEMISKDLFGKFDIKVVNALLELVANLSTGTRIKLSDGRVANVMFTKREHLTRPLVKTIGTEEIIDLSQHTHLFIYDVQLETM